MSRFAAFLRGINLGKRTVKSADLRAAFEAMGFANVKTLLASGNVVFEAQAEPDLAARIEAGLEQKFGFEIGTVIRTHDALQAMVDAAPFKALAPDADAKRYVALLGQSRGMNLKLPFGVEGNFDILAVDDYNIYAVAWHMPNGRYGEGLDTLGKQFPRDTLITMRNWNTILKAAV